jgi:hypothetical protein
VSVVTSRRRERVRATSPSSPSLERADPALELRLVERRAVLAIVEWSLDADEELMNAVAGVQRSSS